MKKRSKKGFTLAELLIVIAIIAVLIAIMFPVFGAQLDKARAAAELANVRAAYSEAVANSLLSTGEDLTELVSTVAVDAKDLQAALKYDETMVTVSWGGTADGTITVEYQKTGGTAYTGSFKTDKDVKFKKSAGDPAADSGTITITNTTIS